MPDGPYTPPPQPMNMLDMASRAASIANAMQQNILIRKTMAAQQATGQAILGHVGADGVVDTNGLMSDAAHSNDPNLAYGAQGLSEYAQAQRQNQALQHQTELKNAYDKMTIIGQRAAALASKPGVSVDDVLSTIADEVNNKVISAQEGAQMYQSVYANKENLPQLLRQTAMQSEDTKTQLEQMYGPHVFLDTGSQIQDTRTPLFSDTSVPGAGSVAAPIQKTLTPGEATAPTAVVLPDGSEGAIQRQDFVRQSAGGKPVRTGLSPAASAAQTTSGAATAKDAVDFETNARQLPSLRTALQNLDGDLAQLRTGPGSSKRASWVAGINGLLGTHINAEDVATQEGIDKIHTEISARLRQTMGLPSTDQSSSIMDHAAPGSQLSKLGNQNISALWRGTIDYGQAANQAWERYKSSGHGSETFHHFATVLNKHLDPLVFQMQYMDSKQAQAVVGAMTPAERQRLAQSNAFARANGLVK